MAHPRWIWPFEILEQIGEGGMGVVYRARYKPTGREVALKMVPADVTDKTALARFERELEVLKTLKHPNIVRCFGGSCEDKRRFYAMELIDGGSLEDQLTSKGKLPWEQVVQYGLQMCAALACSHEKGVVHRDVKPSNFLITPDSHLKLSDFGLASVAASRRITADGKTAGTILYMAPEQIYGQEVTPRTDLYALGCVLFELVTGDVPFKGEAAHATMQMHCRTPPPRPTEKALDCPVLLERVILKLLEKSPDERYQSADEVAKELRAVSQTVTVTHRHGVDHNYPTGFDEATQAVVPVQSAEKMQTVTVSRTNYRSLAIVGGILAISLLLNWIQFGAMSSRHLPEKLWISAYEGGSPEVRTAAAEALGQLAQSSRHCLELLDNDLQAADPARRIAAMTGLAHAGSAGKPVLPKLMKIEQTSPDPQERDAAALAISEIKTAADSGHFPWFTILFTLLILGAAAAGYTWWQKSLND